jgi:hypothetical protein
MQVGCFYNAFETFAIPDTELRTLISYSKSVVFYNRIGAELIFFPITQ